VEFSVYFTAVEFFLLWLAVEFYSLFQTSLDIINEKYEILKVELFYCTYITDTIDKEVEEFL